MTLTLLPRPLSTTTPPPQPDFPPHGPDRVPSHDPLDDPDPTAPVEHPEPVEPSDTASR